MEKPYSNTCFNQVYAGRFQEGRAKIRNIARLLAFQGGTLMYAFARAFFLFPAVVRGLWAVTRSGSED